MRRMKEKKATLICFTMWMLMAMITTQAILSSEEVNGKTFMNPESFMNISERIRYWGYCCEEYEVLTEDGYYLSVNRILGGEVKKKSRNRNIGYYTSVKHVVHVSQLMKSGLFRYFDYGSKNIDMYNQTTPPFYKIEAITVPVAMWSGGQDWVCQPMEIAQLRSQTTNLSERIRHWEYSCEEYEILTEDGYYLSVNRIPGGKTKTETKNMGSEYFLGTR
ncbi:hypothetical protein Chor_013875 [Crotalus horridus]